MQNLQKKNDLQKEEDEVRNGNVSFVYDLAAMGAGWWRVEGASGGAPPPATMNGFPSPTLRHPANLQPKKHGLSFSQCFAKHALGNPSKTT